MPRYPFRRFGFGVLRRLLYLWVRSETINQSSLSLKIDRSKPVLYVLQQPSVSDLAVVDTECRKAGLPRDFAGDVQLLRYTATKFEDPAHD